MRSAGREEFTVSHFCVDLPAFSKLVFVAPHRAAVHDTDLSSLPEHAAIVSVYIGRNITECLGIVPLF